MKKIAAYVCVAVLSAVASAPTLHANTITQATAGMTPIPGYIPLYWDSTSSKLWMQISMWNSDILYIPSLAAGLGSNDVGLDRGKIGDPKVVQFFRAGSRVLLIERNLRFRSSSSNAMEQTAVQDSFASSALWGFDIAAEENGSVLVDATAFFEHDFAGIGQALTQANQGTYTVDQTRCAVYLARTKGFPQNTEIEMMLTFSGPGTGNFVQEVTPQPDSITLREHHSFIQLPDSNYKPRVYDPRAGYFALTYRDYSAPLGSDVDQRYVTRFRLQHANQSQLSSGPAVKPIVYYIDGGAPADVQAALTQGAGWWEQAFEAAGFTGAFQVQTLPGNVDAMDIRYNVVQWVDRYTRGWSYGSAIADPRTGEILKGQVTLGSLRYRQDFLIFSGLLSPFGSSSAVVNAKNLVYARLRQLAAHEIGHTLGLAHNFAASANNRESVMDYPFPLVTANPDGTINTSSAYTNGIGNWDKIAIRYGYTEYPVTANERTQLNIMMGSAVASGHIFVSDADARPLGSVHPRAHLWDNGADSPAELERMLALRSQALANFGLNSIPANTPMSKLDETLVPLYFLHRYQTEAAAKWIAGLNYTYAVKGDGQVVTSMIAAADQQRAIKALLDTISPSALTLPESIISLLPPHPPAYERTHESFPSNTGVTFDPIAAAESAATITASLLFEPTRAARLIEYHGRLPQNPGLEELINHVADASWRAPALDGLQGEVKLAIDAVLFRQLLILRADPTSSQRVRSTIDGWLSKNSGLLPAALAQMVSEFNAHPERFTPAAAAPVPPGQPIGDGVQNCVRVLR